MKDTITTHSLWRVIAKDPIYSDPNLANDIIDYFCKKNSLSFKAIYNRDIFLDKQSGDNDSDEFRLVLCECLDEAYRKDPDGNIRAYCKPSSAEKLAETILRLWIECGLEVEKNEQVIIDDPERHTFYDFVAFAGMDNIERQSLKSFLQDSELPLPTELFGDEQSNTHSIHKELMDENVDSSWTRELSYDDLARTIDKLKDNHRQNTVKDKDICQFVKSANFFKVTYLGKKATIKDMLGMRIIYYLISKQNVDVSLNDLHTEVYGEPIVENKSLDEIADYSEGGLSVSLATDQKQVKQKQDKIYHALQRAYLQIKEELPLLEKHLTRWIVTERGYKYSPEKTIDWKLY